MSEGLMLPPGAGRRIVGGGLDATVKTTMDQPALTSTFEVVVRPGWDVGAHVHAVGEEIFYVLEGQLDVLAFEPLDRSVADWHEWESATGQRFLRGGPGAFLFVPPNTPHAFGNSSDQPAKVFFQSSVPGGHEHYFDELMELLAASAGKPDPQAVAELRTRYDIEQITSLDGGRAPAGA
ncbi:cupin domain-containing protein [uncultured Jatrophihabitans sp.]|uniref:cupin domain-containing protein n=1 Tax=uncultured Jatrophihabitans sp. TaxID=1610747 RepID=UPI0035CBA6F1